jgi:hypothetical protein
MESTDLTIYYVIWGVLGTLLIISEVLGWSKCKANSITQVIACTCEDKGERPPRSRTGVIV